MFKKSSDPRTGPTRAVNDEPRPPLLSEKLIAQLQCAVSAAQRKRMSGPAGTESGSSEKDR
jgi:hypothetical protein